MRPLRIAKKVSPKKVCARHAALLSAAFWDTMNNLTSWCCLPRSIIHTAEHYAPKYKLNTKFGITVYTYILYMFEYYDIPQVDSVVNVSDLWARIL